MSEKSQNKASTSSINQTPSRTGAGGFLRNIKISRRLGLGFGIMVLLSISLGAVAFYTTALEDAALEEFIAAEEETFLLEKIEVQLLEARKNELEFLLFHADLGYDVAFQQYVLANQANTTEMSNLVEEARAGITGTSARDVTSLKNLDQIEVDIEEYVSSFAELVENIRIRGDESTGEIFRILSDMNELDASPETAGEAEIEVLRWNPQSLRVKT